MPRYFKADGSYVGTEYDQSTMVIDQDRVENNYSFKYRITRPAQRLDVIDEELGLLTHPYKKDKDGKDIIELGTWDYSGDYPQTKVDGKDFPAPPPADRAHEDTVFGIEYVVIVRDMTEEEKDAYDRAQQKIVEDAKVAQEQQAQINEILENDGALNLVNLDKAGCILYESAPKNAITDTDAFALMYSNRITRGEITISDCPEELKEKIEEIQVSLSLTSLDAKARDGKYGDVDYISRKYKTGTKATFILNANDGFRVPTKEELYSGSGKFTAKDKDGKVLKTYLEDHTDYYENGNQATINIYFDEECASIVASIECIPVLEK